METIFLRPEPAALSSAVGSKALRKQTGDDFGAFLVPQRGVMRVCSRRDGCCAVRVPLCKGGDMGKAKSSAGQPAAELGRTAAPAW